MDDFDIYDDLSIPEEAENETTQELKRIISQLEQENNAVKTERDKFKETVGILEKNLSSLLKTAKTEISRNNKTINELRSRLDGITFRRHQRHQTSWPRPPETAGNIHKEFEKVKAANFSYPPPPIPVRLANNVDLQEMFCNTADNYETVEQQKAYQPRNSRLDNDIFNNYSDDDEEKEEETVRKSDYTTLYGERLKKRLMEEEQNEKRKKQVEVKLKTESNDVVDDKENLLNASQSVEKSQQKPEIKPSKYNGIKKNDFSDAHLDHFKSDLKSGLATKEIGDGIIKAKPISNGERNIRPSRYDRYHSDSSEKNNRDTSKHRSPESRRSHHRDHNHHRDKHSVKRQRSTPRKHKTPKKNKKIKSPEKLKVKTPKRKKRSYSKEKSPIKAKRRKVDESKESKTKDAEKSRIRDKDNPVKPQLDNEKRLRENLEVNYTKPQDDKKSIQLNEVNNIHQDVHSEIKSIASTTSEDESKTTKEKNSVDGKKCVPVQKEDLKEIKKSSKNSEPSEAKKVDDNVLDSLAKPQNHNGQVIEPKTKKVEEVVSRDRKKYSLRYKEEKSYKKHRDDVKISKEQEKEKSKSSNKALERVSSNRRSSKNLPKETTGHKSTVVETKNTKRNSNRAKEACSNENKKPNLPKEKIKDCSGKEKNSVKSKSKLSKNKKIQCSDESMEEGEIEDSTDESMDEKKIENPSSLFYQALTSSKSSVKSETNIIEVSREQNMSVNKTLTKHLALVKAEDGETPLNCRDKEILKKLYSEPLVRPTLEYNSSKDNKSQVKTSYNTNEQSVLEKKDNLLVTPSTQEIIVNKIEKDEVVPVRSEDCEDSDKTTQAKIDLNNSDPTPAPLNSVTPVEFVQETVQVKTNGIILPVPVDSQVPSEVKSTEVVQKKNVIVIKLAGRRRRPVLSDSPAPKCYELK